MKSSDGLVPGFTRRRNVWVLMNSLTIAEQSLSTVLQSPAKTTRGARPKCAALSLSTPFTLIVYSEVHRVANAPLPVGWPMNSPQSFGAGSTANFKRNGSLAKRAEDTSKAKRNGMRNAQTV